MTIFRSRLFTSSLWLLLLTIFAFVYTYIQNNSASVRHFLFAVGVEPPAILNDELDEEEALGTASPGDSAFQHNRSNGNGGASTGTAIAGDASLKKRSGSKEEWRSKRVFKMNEAYVPENMPYWLGKFPFMPSSEEIDDEDRICYVHVGKTAGSTIACALGFSYDTCPKKRVKIPSENLAFMATNMIHKEFNDCKDKKMSRYLFIVRDPLARMQSWFTYERPDPKDPCTSPKNVARSEKLYADCPFPTFDALGGPEGLGATDGSMCSKRARKAITGETGYVWHNMYNYEYYYDEVIAQDRHPRILVLRTEHLEDDWSNIEYNFLGGPRLTSNHTFPHKHKSRKEKDDFYLSAESKANICHALCEEIQIYKQILAQAENLKDSDYEISMRELEKSCPVEARLTNCQSD